MNFLTLQLAIIESGHWQPGIGDPTFMGWFTVIAYLATSFICFICGLKTSHLSKRLSRYRWFWWSFAIILLLLGINKQLDLQSLVTVIGKDLAISQGWYDRRRTIQVYFIAAIAALFFSWMMFLWQAMGDALKKFILSLFGMGFLLSFILIRASSFHHIDQLLGWHFWGFKMNWFLELSGIACIGISASNHLRQLQQVDKIDRL